MGGSEYINCLVDVILKEGNLEQDRLLHRARKVKTAMVCNLIRIAKALKKSLGRAKPLTNLFLFLTYFPEANYFHL